MRTYYFYKNGELVTYVDSKSDKQAVSLFHMEGFKKDDIDFVFFYDRQKEKYQFITKETWGWL